MRKVVLISLILMFTTAAWAAPATTRATQPTTKRTTTTAARPTKAIAPKDCVTSECHGEVKSFAFVHGPVNVNACDACHELTDAKAHKFQPSRKGGELCTYCHEMSLGGLQQHKPVKTGECIGCHDPHGGNTRSILREASVSALCGRCHESMTLARSHIHTPVAKGECDTCHAPHAAKYPKLLDAVGADLCLACHTKLEQEVAASKFRHKAMDKGCDKCHDPHASDNDKQMLQPLADQCTSCHEHEKIRQQATTASHKHTVVMEEKACITCHSPHASNVDKLMSDAPLKVCIGCHDEKIEGSDVAAVPEVIDPKMRRHGALKDGQCSGCHASHGNNNPSMLTKSLSTAHYQRFAPENFELCFSCHDVNLAVQATTKEKTNFRNGEKNLHWVHVVQQADRGEGCRVCHDVHATPGEKNVRDKFVYGKRELPIHFIATATGGSCQSGCHVPYAYDRNKPIPATTQATTRPAPAVARNEKPPAVVKRILSDVRGKEITIPDPRQITLLLVLGTDPAEGEKALKRVAPAVEGKAVRVVTVLCGQAPANAAQALAARSPWPVCVDADGSLLRSAGVTGWPAMLLIGTDGVEMARIGGLPESLSLRLDAYLGHASGATDAASLHRAIATQNSVEASGEKRAERIRRVAEALRAAGKVEEAQKLLEKGIDEIPGSVPLQVERIKTLLQLNQGFYAMELINQLPEAGLAPGERELLRARVFVSQQRWDQARVVLGLALKANAKSVDAHYLLGQVYESQKLWEQAAREYRAAQELK